jgi:hypothetical protein
MGATRALSHFPSPVLYDVVGSGINGLIDRMIYLGIDGMKDRVKDGQGYWSIRDSIGISITIIIHNRLD